MSGDLPPSPWVERHAAAIELGAPVLDLAAGSGRHARLLAGRGLVVTAVDRDVTGLPAGMPGLEVVQADLENGAPWPLPDRQFAGIVVTNYLHRPLFAPIVAALAPGGLLIYETFQRGNERYGRPSNPDFLLEPGELLVHADKAGLTAIGYFSGYSAAPKPAVVQRIAARRS